MDPDGATRELLDRFRIQNLVSQSIIARDVGDWHVLAENYHPEAVLATSWFTGTPAEFIEKSQEMKIARHPGESQKHLTSNFVVYVNGDRGVSECDVVLFQRRLINDIEFDFSTWSRRIDLVERHGQAWKIWQATFIYEKDRMDPAKPGPNLQDFYDSMDLSPYPAEIRYHCWRNNFAGFPPSYNICIKGSQREKDIRTDASEWLRSA